jgi:hypothetical protein
VAVGAVDGQVGAQRGVGEAGGEAAVEVLGHRVEGVQNVGADDLFGDGPEVVVVAGDRLVQKCCRGFLFADARARCT